MDLFESRTGVDVEAGRHNNDPEFRSSIAKMVAEPAGTCIIQPMMNDKGKKMIIREKYQELLADSVVESMDMDSLIKYAKDCLVSAYAKLDETQFREELENFGPDGLSEEYLTDLVY